MDVGAIVTYHYSTFVTGQRFIEIVAKTAAFLPPFGFHAVFTCQLWLWVIVFVPLVITTAAAVLTATAVLLVIIVAAVLQYHGFWLQLGTMLAAVIFCQMEMICQWFYAEGLTDRLTIQKNEDFFHHNIL